MKIKQILLCMLLACFILPASAQNSWGIVGGGLFSKSLSRDARFSLGGYAGGMYDVHVKNSWYVQPQLLFTYEEFRSKKGLVPIPFLVNSIWSFLSLLLIMLL